MKISIHLVKQPKTAQVYHNIPLAQNRFCYKKQGLCYQFAMYYIYTRLWGIFTLREPIWQ